MRLLKEFCYDQEKPCERYRFRKAARAILFNDRNQIAVINVSNRGYYKIPGGGIEKDENAQAALAREIIEEVGNCDIEVTDEVGCILECGNEFKLIQISYCFAAKVIGKVGLPNPTETEKKDGFKIEWHTINDAVKIMENAKADRKSGTRMMNRDLLFIKEYINKK